MRSRQLLAIAISMAVMSSAIAEAPATPVKSAMAAKAAKPAKAIKPATLTCEDFLAVDEVSRPAIVYWSEGANSKGKPEEGVFDVQRTDRMVPILIEECTKEPKTPFWKKVKMEIKKAF